MFYYIVLNFVLFRTKIKNDSLKCADTIINGLFLTVFYSEKFLRDIIQ